MGKGRQISLYAPVKSFCACAFDMNMTQNQYHVLTYKNLPQMPSTKRHLESHGVEDSDSASLRAGPSFGGSKFIADGVLQFAA